MSLSPLSGCTGFNCESVQSERARPYAVQQERVDTFGRENSVREQYPSLCGSLPLDILGLIATALVTVDPCGIWSFRSVCRAWGEAALCTPRAWSKVHLEKPRAFEQTWAWVLRAKAVPIELAVTHSEAVHPGLQSVLAGRRIFKLHTPVGLLKSGTYNGAEFCGLDTLSIHCSGQEEVGPLLDKLLPSSTQPSTLQRLNLRGMIANPDLTTLVHLKALHLTLSTLWLADFAILIQSLSGTLQNLHLQQCNILPGRRGRGNTFTQASPITLPRLNDLAIITGSGQTEVWGLRFRQHEDLLSLVTSPRLKRITCSSNLLDTARDKFEETVEEVGVELIRGENDDGRKAFGKAYGWKNLRKLQLIGPTAKLMNVLEDASFKLRTGIEELVFLVEVPEESKGEDSLGSLVNMAEKFRGCLMDSGRLEVVCAVKRRSMAGYGVPWSE
jgi:hypothetical protein